MQQCNQKQSFSDMRHIFSMFLKYSTLQIFCCLSEKVSQQKSSKQKKQDLTEQNLTTEEKLINNYDTLLLYISQSFSKDIIGLDLNKQLKTIEHIMQINQLINVSSLNDEYKNIEFNIIKTLNSDIDLNPLKNLNSLKNIIAKYIDELCPSTNQDQKNQFVTHCLNNFTKNNTINHQFIIDKWTQEIIQNANLKQNNKFDQHIIDQIKQFTEHEPDNRDDELLLISPVNNHNSQPLNASPNEMQSLNSPNQNITPLNFPQKELSNQDLLPQQKQQCQNQNLTHQLHQELSDNIVNNKNKNVQHMWLCTNHIKALELKQTNELYLQFDNIIITNKDQVSNIIFDKLVEYSYLNINQDIFRVLYHNITIQLNENVKNKGVKAILCSLQLVGYMNHKRTEVAQQNSAINRLFRMVINNISIYFFDIKVPECFSQIQQQVVGVEQSFQDTIDILFELADLFLQSLQETEINHKVFDRVSDVLTALIRLNNYQNEITKSINRQHSQLMLYFHVFLLNNYSSIITEINKLKNITTKIGVLTELKDSFIQISNDKILLTEDQIILMKNEVYSSNTVYKQKYVTAINDFSLAIEKLNQSQKQLKIVMDKLLSIIDDKTNQLPQLESQKSIQDPTQTIPDTSLLQQTDQQNLSPPQIDQIHLPLLPTKQPLFHDSLQLNKPLCTKETKLNKSLFSERFKISRTNYPIYSYILYIVVLLIISACLLYLFIN
jgi:hypothetical protein